MPNLDLYYLNKNHIERICHPLAVTFLNKINDPISIFSAADMKKLDACLNLPRATFNGREMYSDLISKAAILYYAIIKNHCFLNGNKRIATTSLIVFLFINNYWLEVGQNFLYDLALAVAQSEGKRMDEVKKLIIDKITPHIISLKVGGKSRKHSGFLFHLGNLKHNFKELTGKK
ncbi:MAG: hypothetical protein A3J65_02455 [Candidatus Buchananbacteria bacterium RIFCSPHIGHO2_02_FULL_45_11b]|uniref:Fido domain-containing protein n=2 Tax=Candidatus Buchananiibacteriota TaxID=1817903 RepID=A0A1G1Y927_9BACT|nr:MAG: hypothetical protein A2663_00010 [Candidatus Buchananbacteria bacterium RIFCSPHIGHO2_01_FULL_46_12]OGY51409.1 MAG: hypothetical protein A3J65_02455 [Candidatus Buchananbacteria bacterium RIFCSPHIGHO2_02_FULL_45_11b]